MKSTNDLDKRLRDVIYFPQTDTFLVTFLDGRAYHLPKAAFAADLEFDHTSLITAVTIGTDLDYYFTIHFASGAMFEVPWDRVLHECEPAYAYFKGRRLKQDRADFAYEAQQVHWLRQQAGLTQEALAKRAGLARPNLARVESGRYRPSLETLARIACALGQPVSVLIALPAPPARQPSPGLAARKGPREQTGDREKESLLDTSFCVPWADHADIADEQYLTYEIDAGYL